jgi:uncharacterized membrane protein HdeD (DUF308 family)
MLSLFPYRWPVMRLRGIVTVSFGLLLLILPQVALTTLSLLIGIFLITDGLISLIATRNSEHNSYWRAAIIEGGASIIIGSILISRLDIFIGSISGLVAVWAMIRGSCELASASQIAEVLRIGWLLALTGFLSFGLGLLLALSVLVVSPLTITLSYFCLIIGILFLIFAYQLHKNYKLEVL